MLFWWLRDDNESGKGSRDCELIVVMGVMGQHGDELVDVQKRQLCHGNFQDDNRIPFQGQQWYWPYTNYIPMNPTNPCGAVEMPVLADEPRGLKRKRCFRCKSINHTVSQCPATRKNKKYIKCRSATHKTAKCHYHTTHSPPPFEEGKIISPFVKQFRRKKCPFWTGLHC